MAPGSSQTTFWMTFCRFGLYFRSIFVDFRRKTAIIPPALYSRSGYHFAANRPKPAKNTYNPPCFVPSFRHPFCGKLAKPLTAPPPSSPPVARRSLRSKLNPPRCFSSRLGAGGPCPPGVREAALPPALLPAMHALHGLHACNACLGEGAKALFAKNVSRAQLSSLNARNVLKTSTLT